MKSGFLEIRKIKIDDLDFIYDCICDLSQQRFEKNSFEQILKNNLGSSNALYLLAEIQQKPVGFITFHIQELLHHGGRVGEIQEFYIQPLHRGKGIGRKLMQEFFEYA